MTLPVDGIKLHRGNFAAIGQQIQPLLDAGQCFRLQLSPGARSAAFLRTRSATCGIAKSVNTSSPPARPLLRLSGSKTR